MELPQPRPFGTEGIKATHDFLSLYPSSSPVQQDPTPPQGGYLKTQDFLQPLERVGKNVTKEREGIRCKEFLQSIDENGLNDDQLIIGMYEKEREIKVKARMFSLMSEQMRMYFVLTEELIANHIQPYFPEIKSLLDKMKDLNEHLLSNLLDVVNKLVSNETLIKLGEETGAEAFDSFTKSQIASMSSSEKYSVIEPEGATELAELNTLENSKNIESQRKHQAKQVGVESMEMLKVRAVDAGAKDFLLSLTSSSPRQSA